MTEWNEAVSTIESGKLDEKLEALYGDVEKARGRYLRILKNFSELFGAPAAVGLFSTPGRTEIGGNHTDHQNGCVLAASVDVDALGVAAENGTNEIRILSEGYDLCTVDLNDLKVHEENAGKTGELIRGVAAQLQKRGFEIRGFDAYVSSDVLSGSGLSSSAAYEMWLGVTMNHMFCGGSVTPIETAQIGQYAENVYFGKPCGLMDQAASISGGVIAIDFRDKENPVVEKIDADFHGHALCIVDSGADHAGLTPAYAAIRSEMEAVAAHFGKKVLREVPREDFIKELPAVREKLGDRAVLRAFHFYHDNERAILEAKALKENRFEDFLALVNESGRSSFMYLQNVSVPGADKHQELAVTLALCDEFLDGKGAFRVHGGGFAGTVQAFVPADMADAFRKKMDAALGSGRCHVLFIRHVGGLEIL